MVITMAKLRMAHASTHGACKPPGPMFLFVIKSSTVNEEVLNVPRDVLVSQSDLQRLATVINLFTSKDLLQRG